MSSFVEQVGEMMKSLDPEAKKNGNEAVEKMLEIDSDKAQIVINNFLCAKANIEDLKDNLHSTKNNLKKISAKLWKAKSEIKFCRKGAIRWKEKALKFKRRLMQMKK